MTFVPLPRCRHQVWRQLWRVTGAADIIALVTDVRNPLYHIPASLYEEVTQVMKKPLVIILNKCDLVSQVRHAFCGHLGSWTIIVVVIVAVCGWW